MLADHLRYISGLLRDRGIIKDVSPIQSAANMYQRSISLENNSYEAEINELYFHNIDPDRKFRKVRPKGISRDSDIELEFNVKLKANLPLVEIPDPFTDLAIDFKLIAFNDKKEYLINSWHIDRHIFEGDERSYFPHPIYHMQYGGKRMTEDEDLNHGNILLLDTPRIACPPFDITLSIDFILCNYYGKIWYEFKEDQRYNDAIKYSRDCFWKAYYKTISESLDSGIITNKNFPHDRLIPQLQQ